MENLREYQVEDLTNQIRLPRCVNRSAAGTGKTAGTCFYSYFRATNDNTRFVWIQPKSLLNKNFREMIDFTPFEASDLVIVQGTPKQKLRQIESGAKGFFLTAEALASYGSRLKELYDIKLVVVDEWHMIYKGHTSKRTQALYQFMRTTPYLVVLSATVVQGNLCGIYPLMHLLEPKLYGNFESFKAYHQWVDDYGNVLGYKNTEKIAKIMEIFSWRRTFEDVYGPESKVVIVEEMDMNPRQKKAYLTFEREALLELSDSFLDGSIPGVNQIRARQILAHGDEITNPMGGIESVVGDEVSAKDERLEVIATDHVRDGTPMIVFAVFRREVDRISRLLTRLGMSVGVIHGGVSQAQRVRVADDFVEGRIQCVVLTPPTGGVGYNFQYWKGEEVEHLVFASMTYDDGDFIQAYRRAVRGVRKTPLRITVLKFNAKVEDRIFELVRKKSELVHSIDPEMDVVDLATGI